MDQSEYAVSRARVLAMVWFFSFFSGPLIFFVLYYAEIMKPFLDAEYELYFLIGGLLSGLIALPVMRHFRQIVAEGDRDSDVEEYWNRVNAEMMKGNGLADVPLFVGFVAMMTGGFIRTALVLLVFSLFLHIRFKPPGVRTDH